MRVATSLSFGADRTSAPGVREFARFYAPLAATSLLLTVTNPILTGALARAGNPTVALTGFGVAFAVTGVLYAPLLVLQQVTATRLLGGDGLDEVRKFALTWGVVSSAAEGSLAFSPVGAQLLRTVVGIRGDALGEALNAVQVLWPVPLLTGLRSIYQGRLVAGRHTGRIAMATALRTTVLATVAALLVARSGGAWLAGLAFTAGLAVETAVVALVPTGRAPLQTQRVTERGSQLRILSLSGPLMLNVVLWWATPLVIASVLARTVDADLAIATFVVVEAAAWFVAAPIGQLQNASIALVDGVRAHLRVRTFAATLALGMTLVLTVLAMPAIREEFLWSWFRLDSGLMAPCLLAFPLTVGYPLLYGSRQYHQGLFVRVGRTVPVARGAVLRMLVIVVGGAVLLRPLGGYGARLGVTLALVGLVVENAYLVVTCRRRVLPVLSGRAGARSTWRAQPRHES
jgi:hypothetical protein